MAASPPDLRAADAGRGSGRRGWLDPRTKVAMLIGMNVVLVCTGFDALGYALKFAMAGITLYFLLESGRGKAAGAFAVLYLLAVGLQLFSETVLFGVMASTSPLAVAVRFLSMMMLQFVPGTLFAYSMLMGTKVSEFVAAMERMRLTEKMIIPFAVVFRFLPTVAEEYRSIRDAMRLRGINWKCGPVAMLEYRLVPLMVSLVKIGDELSAASVTRGLGGSVRRTSSCRVGFGLADVLFGVSVFACVLATVAMRLVEGW